MIVVDDGSTDESRKVIARYGDRVIAVLKENGGQASAFNAGFAAARGEVVIFLDADDVLLPTAARSAVDRFAPGVTKVYWPLWEMDSQGTAMGTMIPNEPLPEGNFRDRVLLLGPIACREAPTSGNAWSRDFLERALPMPEREFKINSDCYLSTLAPIYGEVRTLADPHSRYRIHGANHYVLMTVGEKAGGSSRCTSSAASCSPNISSVWESTSIQPSGSAKTGITTIFGGSGRRLRRSPLSSRREVGSCSWMTGPGATAALERRRSRGERRFRSSSIQGCVPRPARGR